MEEIKITIQGTEVIASPFKRTNPKEDEIRYSNLKDIKGLQQRNNFTNQILGTISSQLDRIEKNLPKSKETEYEKPLFKSPEFNKPIKLGNKYNDLIKTLAKKLEAMNITDPSTSKRQINFLSGSETESSSSENQTQNSDQENDQINRIKYNKSWQQETRNYYPKSTPPELQYEERLPPRAMYNDTFIYEWNIDGLSVFGRPLLPGGFSGLGGTSGYEDLELSRMEAVDDRVWGREAAGVIIAAGEVAEADGRRLEEAQHEPIGSWRYDSWESSCLAKFSEFLGFPTKGFEKEILELLRNLVASLKSGKEKGNMTVTKSERELRRLKSTINYNGKQTNKGGGRDKGNLQIKLQ